MQNKKTKQNYAAQSSSKQSRKKKKSYFNSSLLRFSFKNNNNNHNTRPNLFEVFSLRDCFFFLFFLLLFKNVEFFSFLYKKLQIQTTARERKLCIFLKKKKNNNNLFLKTMNVCQYLIFYFYFMEKPSTFIYNQR